MHIYCACGQRMVREKTRERSENVRIYNNLGSQVFSGWQVHAYHLDCSPDQQSLHAQTHSQAMNLRNKLGYYLKIKIIRLPCVKQEYPRHSCTGRASIKAQMLSTWYFQYRHVLSGWF